MSPKILVIEDDLSILENLIETLSLAEYEVEGADNGRSGLEAAKVLIPDVIICDILMPEMDGWSVFEQLQRMPQTTNIPFIFLTAHVDRASVQKGYALGAAHYITKPFTNAELLEAVQTCLTEP